MDLTFAPTGASNTASVGARPPRPFSKLPTELKALVFKKLSQEGKPSDLLNSILACKEWSQICTPVLWEHVFVTNGNFIRFVENLENFGQEKGPLVHSLTILLRPMPKKNLFAVPGPSSLGLTAERARVGDVTKEIRKLIPTMRLDISVNPESQTVENLTLILYLIRLSDVLGLHLYQLRNLSFRIAGLPPSPLEQWHGTFTPLIIPYMVYKKFVSAIPQSCCSLDIEDHYSARLTPPMGNHLCDSVRKVIPRLQYLHISSGAICPCLFDPCPYPEEVDEGTTPFENMRVMTISIHNTDGYHRLNVWPAHFRPFCKENNIVDSYKASLASEKPKRKIRRFYDMLARTLRHGYDQGKFPNIQHIALFECFSEHPGRSENDQTHSFDHVRYDIIGNKVDMWPSAWVASINAQNEMILDPRLPTPDVRPWQYWLRWYFVTYHDDNVEYVHSTTDFIDSMQPGWKTSRNNVRHPNVPTSHRTLYFDSLEPKEESYLMTMEEFTAKLHELFPGAVDADPLNTGIFSLLGKTKTAGKVVPGLWISSPVI